MTQPPPIAYEPWSPGIPAGVGIGLYPMSGGGPITVQTVENILGDGYFGVMLNPFDNWDASGLVLNNGFPNFLIKSYMRASIGFNGVPIYSTGHIWTGTNAPVDGIQVYTTNPGSQPTQGLIFEGCAIVGNNPGGAVLHFGGGQRACGLNNSFVFNTSSVTGSYGVITDTQLSNNNGEDMIFTFSGGGGVAGNYAAVGIGTNDQTQRSNDTVWYSIRTVGGIYSIVLANGGGHTFINAYDRSNPSTATYYNHGSTRTVFAYGEDRNTAGLCHLVDASACRTIIHNRAVTQGGTAGSNTMQVSAGTIMFQGGVLFNTSQAIAISGTGKVIIADPCTDPSNLSINGSAGTVNSITATKYLNGTGPGLGGFTGTSNVLF